jgi:integrase
MALTKRDIDRLEHDPAGPATQIHYDGDDRQSVPGFGVRVFPSGAKSFVVWYRTTKGRKRLHTIGRFGAFTVEQARKEARRLIVEASTGADPIAERQDAREASTVAELADLYIERHAKPHKKTWKEDERRIEKHIKPALGARKVADVKRPDVSRLHNKIGTTAPYEANRVLALVAVMFTKAEEWGLVEEGTPNPAARVQTYKEHSRERWITPAELPALVAAIDAEPSEYVRAALKLYLVTGLRRNELLALRWKDVDLERREIRLGDTKAGRPHVVPVTSTAEAILRTLPRGIGNAPVFPGDRRGKDEKKRAEAKPLVNINKPWRRVRARFWLAKNPETAAELRARAERDVARAKKHAGKGPEAIEARLIQLAQQAAKGEEDVRLHDLRRTVGSWLATAGASLPLIGKVLNHSTPSTTQVYARLAEDPARAALEEHDARIGPLLTGTAAATP